MIGPVVHGPPILGPVMLVGQAPGPREGSFGKPFAWTAGRTLFGWFERSLGLDEEQFRSRVYMAAVARCFPGKAPGGGDRRPDKEEIARCETWLAGEAAILRPRLVIAVGTLAIERVLGRKVPLAEIVGSVAPARWHGVDLAGARVRVGTRAGESQGPAARVDEIEDEESQAARTSHRAP